MKLLSMWTDFTKQLILPIVSPTYFAGLTIAPKISKTSGIWPGVSSMHIAATLYASLTFWLRSMAREITMEKVQYMFAYFYFHKFDYFHFQNCACALYYYAW